MALKCQKKCQDYETWSSVKLLLDTNPLDCEEAAIFHYLMEHTDKHVPIDHIVTLVFLLHWNAMGKSIMKTLQSVLTCKLGTQLIECDRDLGYKLSGQCVLFSLPDEQFSAA